MSLGYDYSSIILNPLRKNNRIPIILFVLYGISILVVTLLSVAVNYYIIYKLWPWKLSFVNIEGLDSLINNVLRWSYIVGIASVLPFTFWFLKEGIPISWKSIKWGLYDLRRPRYLGNIPADIFSSEKERGEFLYNSLRKKALSIYSPLDEAIGSFITIVVGERSGLIAPGNKGAVKKIGVETWNKCKKLIGLLAVLSLSVWLYSYAHKFGILKYVKIEVVSEVIGILLNDFSTKVYFSILILSLATVLVAIVLDALMIKSLLPKGKIFTDCDQESVFLEGFGHPYQIINRLPELISSLQLEKNFPNRIYDKDMSFEKIKSMSDSGLAKGKMFIEQQPQYIGSQGRAMSYLFLVFGIAFCVGGFSMLFTPAFFYELLISGLPIEKHLIGAPLLIIMALSWAGFAIKIGVNLIEHAFHRFNTFRFRSVGIFIEVEGSMGKADIKIGKSETDSIGIVDNMIRSDLKVELWSADLISQSIGIDKKRSLISFNKSNDSKMWLNTVRDILIKLHQEGVKTSVLSTASKQLREVIDSNLLISKIKDQKDGNMIIVKESESISGENKQIKDESGDKEEEVN